MATTFHEFNGNQGTGTNNAEYAFTFKSLQESDVKVALDGVLKTVTTHYTISNYTKAGGGKIVFTAGNIPSTAAQKIRIFRDTDVDTAKATYTAGASIKASDLNDNHEQILYSLQEEQTQTLLRLNVKDLEITREKIAADAVDGTKLADDAVDSEHYTDGSIDLAHMSANSVDSDQYVDGSVDLVHLSANSVDSSKIVDGSITNADINASAAIDGSKIAAGTTSAPGTISAADKT